MYLCIPDTTVLSKGRGTTALCVSHTQLYVYTAAPTKFSRYLKLSSVESENTSMTHAAHARRGSQKGIAIHWKHRDNKGTVQIPRDT